MMRLDALERNVPSLRATRLNVVNDPKIFTQETLS